MLMEYVFIVMRTIVMFLTTTAQTTPAASFCIPPRTIRSLKTPARITVMVFTYVVFQTTTRSQTTQSVRTTAMVSTWILLQTTTRSQTTASGTIGMASSVALPQITRSQITWFARITKASS